MTGIAFVDGRNPDGSSWGSQVPVCHPCEDARYPFPRLETERKARIAKRLSHREAATLLGVTPVLLSQYEHGALEVPDDLLAAMRELYKGPNND
jgi:hypothetical protein